MKTTFIVNSATGSLNGISTTGTVAGDQIAVKKAEHLEVMTLGNLTALYNSVTGETKGTFKISKALAAEKVYAALQAADVSKLVQLDKSEKTKVVKAAAKVKAADGATAATPGVRKVRDSKLQRMAAAFRSQGEDGKYAQLTIKQLMEACGTTEKMTHQYISILRAQNDRFKMPIVKDKESNTFAFSPN